MKVEETNIVAWIGSNKEPKKVYKDEKGILYVLMENDKNKVYMTLSANLLIHKIAILS